MTGGDDPDRHDADGSDGTGIGDEGPGSGDGDLPTGAYLLALASLPGMTPTRLLVAVATGRPASTWVDLVGGRQSRVAVLAAALGRDGHEVVAGWRRAASATDPATLWQRHVDAGVDVLVPGSPSWPAEDLAGLRAPPLVLCARGGLAALAHPRVAIVGTRSCTRYGLAVARGLGEDLAAAGVTVVSGLALGIDGAAHVGALAAAGAPPMAVVAGGLDRVYPPRHRQLWAQVAATGLVVSECPLGVEPTPWRFPARNRLIAALADVTVVVESHERGGSLVTAEAAEALQRHVLAVPGPVHSPASAGTNGLLADRAGMCRDADDVLVVLGMTPGARRVGTAAETDAGVPDGAAAQVLAALDHEAATIDQLALRTGLALDDLVVELARLGLDGRVVERAGWYERTTRGR